MKKIKYITTVYNLHREIRRVHERIPNHVSDEKKRDELLKKADTFAENYFNKDHAQILKSYMGDEKKIVFVCEKDGQVTALERGVGKSLESGLGTKVNYYHIKDRYPKKSEENLKKFLEADNDEYHVLIFSGKPVVLPNIKIFFFIRSGKDYDFFNHQTKTVFKLTDVKDVVVVDYALGSDVMADCIELRRNCPRHKKSYISFYDENSYIKEFYEEFFVDIRSQWDIRYEELKAFKEKYGHVDLTKANQEGENYTPLGVWCTNQRALYRRGDSHLTDLRKLKLDQLGFKWEIKEDSWEKSYKKLIKYKEEHGTLSVSKNIDKVLAEWITTQKKRISLGRMSEDRINKLKEIGFEFRTKQEVNDAVWNEKFEELSRFKELYKHTNVQRNYDNSLYHWIMTQRARKRDGKLSEERLKKLESIGFQWFLRKR